jgi:hypothetical protein
MAGFLFGVIAAVAAGAQRREAIQTVPYNRSLLEKPTPEPVSQTCMLPLPLDA